MKLAALTLAALAGVASAQTYVNPYVRQDGTYVPGHVRSAPDSTKLNNYSTQGNVNPYTGQTGTVNPYTQPTPYVPSRPTPNAFPSPCHTDSWGKTTCR